MPSSASPPGFAVAKLPTLTSLRNSMTIRLTSIITCKASQLWRPPYCTCDLNDNEKSDREHSLCASLSAAVRCWHMRVTLIHAQTYIQELGSVARHKSRN